MSYLYEQASGKFIQDGPLGLELLAIGYSGFSDAKNDPLAQNQPGMGPIPRGQYLLGLVEEDTIKHGPIVIHLVPQTATETAGRFGFLIHGDSVEAPGAASHGCIILPRKVRERLADGKEKQLTVVSGLTAKEAA